MGVGVMGCRSSHRMFAVLALLKTVLLAAGAQAAGGEVTVVRPAALKAPVVRPAAVQAPVIRAVAVQAPVIRAVAVQAPVVRAVAPGRFGPAEAADTVAGAGRGATDGRRGPDPIPPGPVSPETTGPVEMGPVEAALTEHGVAVELRGSPESMARQHAVAVASELSFVGTLEDMELLAEEGALVPIYGGPHYEVMDWVFPYAIPEVRTFVERLAFEYREACGETMVVTSLTRPFSEQPRNAHQLSVHPAGMAVDLRIPQTPDCRAFLDTRLVEMEEAGLLDATHERSPPHFHVAVFAEPYAQWVAAQPPLPDVAPGRERAPGPLPDDAGGVAVWLVVALVLLAAAGAAAWWLVRGSRRGPTR
jgi:hypothetical protein